MDEEIVEFVEKLQGWHEHQVSQLKQIVDSKASSFVINDVEVLSDSDLGKGLKAGVKLSLELLGQLPFTLNYEDTEE